MAQMILFVCTGNSARSVMAESYMNHASRGAWRAYSAGSKPTGKPNPFALTTLKEADIPPQDGDGNAPSSKSWDAFASADAAPMDVIVTVCDGAAGETCPVWPAKNGAAPRTLHWSFPDPAAATGKDEPVAETFRKVFKDIRQRIDSFLLEEQD